MTPQDPARSQMYVKRRLDAAMGMDAADVERLVREAGFTPLDQRGFVSGPNARCMAYRP